MANLDSVTGILGEKDTAYLLDHTCEKVSQASIHVPHEHFFETVFSESDRSNLVVENLMRIANTGRLRRTGYISILPVDQGVEHGAGYSFVKNPLYFDPENIVTLAIEGGCSAIASSVGVLGSIAEKYVDEIPFIVKLNHNDLLRYPTEYDQIMFAEVHQAHELGAVAVGATIYFGSPESKRQIQEVSQAFYEAHRLGMATIAWCYVRNSAFTVDGKNHESAADITGQANYLAASIEADIIKQKMPTHMAGFSTLNAHGVTVGKSDPRVQSELMTDHPIDMVRYQVLNCFGGRMGLINSGGESKGDTDLKEAVYNAVVNKRAGGMGLILGRKAFQKSMEDGISLLHAVQDVYACKEIEIA